MKEKIRTIILDAIKKTFPELDMPLFKLDSADENFGDYATNIAMVLAKLTGQSPKDIAEKLVDILSQEKMFEKVQIAGPGFINFYLEPVEFQKQVIDIVNAKDNYGQSDLGKDILANIEFISANPTGPLTLGNGRNAYFGDTLARILEKYGATVHREYYINDRGVQITALGHSVLQDSEAVYKGDYIAELAPRIKTTDPAEAGEQAATILMEEYIKKTIIAMGIKFDTWFSEKSLHESEAVAKTLGTLESLGLTYKSEGATWLKTTDFGDDKDRVVVTSEGEYTYFASDIAYHFNKMNRGYNLLIDFWGADHHGYIGRLNAAIDMLRAQKNWSGNLEIMICQLVRLVSGGKEVRMSKRAGNFVLLDELLQEVGPDVTRFFFLDRSLDSHMEFDLDLAKEKSDKNPVYYVQYAYARINSILVKSDDKLSNLDIKLDLLTDPAEIDLIKQLIKFPELIEDIAENHQAQKLAFYARELAQTFHNFYEKCPIIKSGSDDLTVARLELLKATKIVLKNTLDLLGVSAPEKM